MFPIGNIIFRSYTQLARMQSTPFFSNIKLQNCCSQNLSARVGQHFFLVGIRKVKTASDSKNILVHASACIGQLRFVEQCFRQNYTFIKTYKKLDYIV